MNNWLKIPLITRWSLQRMHLTPLTLLMACSSIAIASCATAGAGTGFSANNAQSSSLQAFDAVEYDKQNASRVYTPTVTEEVFTTGDKVTVTVNGFSEFSGVYNVNNSGDIFLGHIGNVKTAGLTIPELQTTLYQGYGACCLVNPNVSIEREGQDFGKIVVDGAVNNAGIFEVEEVIKLSQAIALGGGASELANTEVVMLARVIDGERKVSQVNLKSIQLDGAPDPLVYPNDVIFVQDSKGRILYNDFIKTVPIISALIFAATR